MRISDWSSDVCSSDLREPHCDECPTTRRAKPQSWGRHPRLENESSVAGPCSFRGRPQSKRPWHNPFRLKPERLCPSRHQGTPFKQAEHKSELQSLMRNSYAILSMKKNKQ